ncbi:hypothetical Protein YC6258_04122 [Gynuella sunshinyii YC6258]|uniref:Uncharacterized protein n=1 Tax=Gynuella sunshinyii YC6258 TaxID=1445510 RepID=A0A0C5W0E8_9GAMM|nr:hypothetical Protein YC6258_04122 [Gynuella sunshinyii YC6258]
MSDRRIIQGHSNTIVVISIRPTAAFLTLAIFKFVYSNGMQLI